MDNLSLLYTRGIAPFISFSFPDIVEDNVWRSKKRFARDKKVV